MSTIAYNECGKVGALYGYIKNDLENYRAECNRLLGCIREVLKDLNPISMLQGDKIRLAKICRLVNVPDNNGAAFSFNGKCSAKEREGMMAHLNNRLKDKMNKGNKLWEEVSVCLENNYGDTEKTTPLRDICKMAEKEETICGSYKTHRHVEHFMNEQADHLHCTCTHLLKELEQDHDHDLPTTALFGIGAGAILLLCIFFGVLFCCWRRKRNKKKKKRGPNVIYLPAANSDNCPVYQEIYDQRPPGVAPKLPSRYVTRPLPGNPSMDENEYLEPVTTSNSYRSKAPPPLQRLINNPGYELDAPPEYSESDTMYEDAIVIQEDHNNAYFDPIPTPKSGDNTQSYDTLDRHGMLEEQESLPQTYQALAGVQEEEDENYQPLEDLGDESYQALEDYDVNKPLGPDPSQRTKKEDRETESEYFELEKVHQETAID